MSSVFISNNLYLIAEIGGNHEGSFEAAQEQCRLAIESGADCIKFQVYSADGLVNSVQSPDRHAHFTRFELTREQHIALANMCREAGRDYLASIWEIGMVDSLDSYLKHYKIGSGDLTALPMLRQFAQKGKPIILSTGLSTLEEVKWAVNEIRKVNLLYNDPGMIVLLQCTSMYPIPDSDANLSVIQSLADIPNVIVGYSDHTVGIDALVTSVALGARVLEFHFTDQREGREFRDHKVSLMVDEVVDLRRRCEKVITLLGSSKKTPLEIEISTGHVISFRRALYPARNLEAGHVIVPEDLLCLRPCVGIGAEYYDQVVGLKLLRPVQMLEKLDLSFFGDSVE
jgi:N-acetylneuraminate synthase/N,N'-diacetyllegionaminate synthase